MANRPDYSSPYKEVGVNSRAHHKLPRKQANLFPGAGTAYYDAQRHGTRTRPLCCDCGGRGWVRKGTIYGRNDGSMPCPSCGGTGYRRKL
jgi:hypothetical protein